jgi:hypothetical protein
MIHDDASGPLVRLLPAAFDLLEADERADDENQHDA